MLPRGVLKVGRTIGKIQDIVKPFSYVMVFKTIVFNLSYWGFIIWPIIDTRKKRVLMVKR